MSEETENKSYSADSIQVLEGLEAVRKPCHVYRRYRCKRVASLGV